jgi:hypothetical protein
MSTSEPEKKGPRKRKQKEPDAPEVPVPEHKENVQIGVPKRTEKGKQDKRDEKKQQGTTKTHKDEKQGDIADKRNRNGQKTTIQSKGCKDIYILLAIFVCVIVLTISVAGWLAYTAYDDLATRQKYSVNELRRDIENEIKELKSHLGNTVRTSLANEIKLLKNVESRVEKIEEKVKALKR